MTDTRRMAAERICRTLEDAGHRVLLAGGCVRDMLLGVEPKDYDIATSATPNEVAGLFERTVAVGAAFGVQIVILPQGQFEVATFRSDGDYHDGRRPSHVEFVDEKEDALRRDFTINAMFYDLRQQKVVDYVGGQSDLQDGILRTVGNPQDRFSEDHLRLLRAVRFAARLKYDIAPQTLEALGRMAHLIERTSAERIRDEILKMLTEGGARRAFELLDATGLLAHVLPEIESMKGVEQPPQFHPEGDVFEHTLLMLEKLDNPVPALALGALLHDVGKPRTQSFEDRIRFNNHCKVGARMSEKICRRLRLSNDVTERVAWLVEQHMRVAAIPEMRESKRKRFVREEGFAELLELCRLDCLASHNSTGTIDWIKEYIAALKPEEVRPKPLLSGRDLIDMGYEPGPLFAEILAGIEDAQLEGLLRDREQAREFVCQNWRSVK